MMERVYVETTFVSYLTAHPSRDLIVAGQKNQREADATANGALGASWLIAKDWDEKSRYQLWTEFQARELFVAVSDTTNGVTPSIKDRW